MTLGTKLFNLRTAQDMSLDKLAFELEISKTAINNWEADKAKPSIENLLRLCEFYNTDVYKLLEEVSNVNFSHAKFKGYTYAGFAQNFTVNNTTSPELIDSIMTNQTKITELFSQQNELILKLLSKQ
ncbi:helix-turn-helix domain-containing protein [Flavobacterium sp.]|jgi:transcriptional regulator with XRE-family HTH domain|uniref:helix-turn-helix domain-containing protein n=1 Tax=Flavobacterium sp. TaxID=239 RepID=UPI0037C0C500